MQRAHGKALVFVCREKAQKAQKKALWQGFQENHT
jgi:hypothetical protein